jgi:ubiquinone/menaquinone biosynthesis C-methylase UbiE
MTSNFKKKMFEYYDARAEEYEELYKGKGPASIPDTDAYKRESHILVKIVERFGAGKIIDIACGTGFWLPYYAHKCCDITLFDQSKRMLAECRKKVEMLNIQNKCMLLCGDFLTHQFANDDYDRAIIGFFISHLTEEEEKKFFCVLKKILKPKGRFLFFDSTWNEERAKTREKEGKHRRSLNDGREYDIYKRYFEVSDIKPLAEKHGLVLTIEHVGRVFIAALGQFR